MSDTTCERALTVAVLTDQLERSGSPASRDFLKRAINGLLNTFEAPSASPRLVQLRRLQP